MSRQDHVALVHLPSRLGPSSLFPSLGLSALSCIPSGDGRKALGSGRGFRLGSRGNQNEPPCSTSLCLFFCIFFCPRSALSPKAGNEILTLSRGPGSALRSQALGQSHGSLPAVWSHRTPKERSLDQSLSW